MHSCNYGALAFSKILHHSSLLWTIFHHLCIPSFLMFCFVLLIHLDFGLRALLFPVGFELRVFNGILVPSILLVCPSHLSSFLLIKLITSSSTFSNSSKLYLLFDSCNSQPNFDSYLWYMASRDLAY